MPKLRQGLLMGIVLLLPLTAQAQLASCSVSTLAVSFGAIDPGQASATDAAGTVTVTCSGLSLIPYDVALSAGSGAYAQRTMRSGASTLNYNLYTSPTYNTIWGDGSGGTSRVSGSITLLVNPGVHPVYALVPGNQNVAPGTYTDSITVTVTY
ncbi:MAG: spore coat U domain-containing protein [Gammaproteobacteria bacterium]